MSATNTSTQASMSFENVDRTYCVAADCRKRSSFNFRGMVQQYCGIHRKPGMIDVRKISCDLCDCSAAWGMAGGVRNRCFAHKDPTMIQLKQKKRCEHVDCKTVANWALADGVRKWCSKHRPADAKDLANRNGQCIIDGCETGACFNVEGKKAQYCLKHKTTNMINVLSTRCVHDGCNTIPSYNLEGLIAKYCSVHKTDNMVNVVSRRCSHLSCAGMAIFGSRKEGIATVCGKHRTTEYSVNYRRCPPCKADGCNKTPSFGYPNTKAEFCSKHAQNGMLIVSHTLCAESGCKRVPYYAMEGDQAKWCSKHADDGMVNVKTMKCKECKTCVSYGFPQQRPSHCSEHRNIGQVTYSSRRCMVDGCRLYATHGVWTHEHCAEHAQENEENLFEQICHACKLPNVLSAEGVCEFCKPESFVLKRLVKQKAVLNYLQSRNHVIRSHDKIVSSVCGKERPDIVIPSSFGYIVVEVDEHQHRFYENECERVREINISQSLGMPTVFIRFNPDGYKTTGRDNCAGSLDRLKLLDNWINFLMTWKPNGFLCQIRLFYDHFDVSSQKIETVLNFEE